jgi:hypothetical protein
MIPKILHYVWVGPRPLSDEAKRLIDGWHALMPDYEIRFWNNDNVDFSLKFLKEASSVGAWSRVSDFVRLVSLLDHGGIYLDSDVELKRSFTPLLDNKCFVGFQRKDNPSDLVNGAVMGAIKRHWLLEEAKNYLTNKLRGTDNFDPFTGPGVLTHLLRCHGLRAYSDVPIKVKDVTVFPRRYIPTDGMRILPRRMLNPTLTQYICGTAAGGASNCHENPHSSETEFTKYLSICA